MWKILQQKKPNDFVIATGEQYTVKDFVNLTAKHLNLKILWKGKGLNEKAYDKFSQRIIVSIDKKYFRPTEVDTLLGDSKKARRILNWKPRYNINDLIKDMINYEEKNLIKN
jgi:GDPmannose 4,6-dehydratase